MFRHFTGNASQIDTTCAVGETIVAKRNCWRMFQKAHALAGTARVSDNGMRWTFIVGDEDLAVPALHTFLEGPDARFARLSSARNLYAWDGQPYALVDYDIIVDEPFPHKDYYNMTIVSEDVDGNHTSVCKVLLWDPQFVASSLFELMTMTLKFTMSPAFDTRPRFSHCPPTLQASGEHFSADEELMMVAAEAYLSPPNVRLVDRRLKLFAQNEPECTLNWYCVNYLIVNGRRPLNIAALGKFEITIRSVEQLKPDLLDLNADFGGTNATECRIVLIAKSRSDVLSECNATEAAASSTSAPSSATSVQTSERTTDLAFGLILAVASTAFAVGCVCGHQMQRHGLPLLPTVTWTRDANAL
ncbi:hypothetical protein AAVH_27279 [Aphelenchoides avenae]|nr:hypothetical protein AAVH_27279 [Aphelenchus avenae]